MKPKKNYRRKQGHRQPYTKIEITDIKTSTAKAATETKKATETKPEEKKPATEAKKTVEKATANK